VTQGDGNPETENGPDALAALGRRFLGGGAWAFAGRVVAGLGVLAANVLLARLLSPESFGAFVLAYSVVAIGAVAGHLGLAPAAVRLVAESEGKGQGRRAARAVSMSLAGGGVGALALALILVSPLGRWLAVDVAGSAALGPAMALVAAWAAAAVIQALVTENFRGLHDLRLATVFGGLSAGLLGPLAATFCLAAAWLTGMRLTLTEALLVFAATGALSAGLGVWRLRARAARLTGGGALGWTELAVIAAPLWVSSVALVLLSYADVWVLAALRPVEEVAVYGAASRLAAVMTLPFVILNAATAASIAQAHAQGGQAGLRPLLGALSALALLPALGMAAAFVFLGGWAMEIVYGTYYGAGAAVLGVLALGHLVNVWSGPCGIALMMTGNQSVMMLITLAGGTLTIAGAVVLGRVFGVLGVAWAVAGGTALYNLTLWRTAGRRTGIWTHASLRGFGALARSLRK
jgi:O-antigen/teichoic acid export membrane protein